MNWVIVTQSIIASTMAMWVAYDIYVAFFNRQKNDTISRVISDWGNDLSLIPYAAGVLPGHFFGGLSVDVVNPVVSWLIMFAVGVAIAVLHRLALRQLGYGSWLVMSYFMFGIPMGMIFWPLN